MNINSFQKKRSSNNLPNYNLFLQPANQRTKNPNRQKDNLTYLGPLHYEKNKIPQKFFFFISIHKFYTFCTIYKNIFYLHIYVYNEFIHILYILLLIFKFDVRTYITIHRIWRILWRTYVLQTEILTKNYDNIVNGNFLQKKGSF